MDLDFELYAPAYRLPCVSKRITFSMGHIFNDLTSTVYYNFVLLYLMNVAEVNVAQTGYIVLFGQCMGAVASVLVNQIGAHRNALCCCYTRRKSWHLVGTILMVAGFLFLFMACIGCSQVASLYKTIYYGGFVMFFQLGYSFMQISHLYLIPEITRNQHERIELNAIRYTLGLMCKVVVFAILWLLLALSKSSIINDDDDVWFRTLAITITVTGVVTAAVFHIGTEETGFDLFIETHLCTDTTVKMSRTQWAKEPQYYQMVFLHLFTRVSANVAVMYLPLYVTQTLDLHKVYVAVYAFAAFAGSAIFPFATRPLARCSTPKVTYVMGAVLVMGAAAWTWFIKNSWPVYQLQMFGLAIVLGAGGSVTTLSALNMVQAMVGENIESGGFVYNTLSVFEKVLTGVAVLVIQQLNTCKAGSECELMYYRYVFAGVVGGAAAAGFLVLLTLLIVKIGNLRYAGVLIRASINDDKKEEKKTAEGHMAVFDPTPVEDCFNYWSCLSTTRETEAQLIAVIHSAQDDLSDLQSYYDSVSINSGPNDVPGLNRSPSYDGLEGAMGSPSRRLQASSSVPSIIEYSGNHEQHHRRKNTPRDSSRDTAGLVQNEEVPEPTEGLPTYTESSAAAGAAAATTVGGAAEQAPGKDPSGTSTQVDVHPVPVDIHAETNGDGTPGEQGTQGSPYDNVPITVTPGGKIIDNASNA